MRYESAKGPGAVKLGGIKVDFETNGTSLRAVIFDDGIGGHCKVILDGYAMSCLVPAQPKMEDRYVLHGEIEDVGKIRKVFTYKHEAEQAQRDIEGKFRGDLDLKIEKVALPVDDTGEVVDNNIPF